MKKFFYMFAVCTLSAMTLFSCSDDDDPVEPNGGGDDNKEEEVGINGFYILNRGNYGGNNSSIGFYDLKTNEFNSDIYLKANGSSLGESAENLLIYGSKIYAAVTYSNRLAVLDLQGKLLQTIEPTEEDNTLSPRALVAEDGKVYVSYYSGHAIAVIDTLSLQEEKRIPVGRYPEQLAISNNKLYVANSGGMDFPDYNNTVSVIDLKKLEVENEIEVIINPTRLATDKEGDVYLISMGDYENVGSTLQHIDVTTQEVTTIGDASLMAVYRDKIYAIHAIWGDDQPSFILYNTSGDVVKDNFLEKNPGITNPGSIDIDPSNGKIYISQNEYGVTSTMYVFTAEGVLEDSFDIEGYDTQSVSFLNQTK